jgi:hypothetical protein
MQFQLVYDGDALTNHEIDPKELSIALLAINELLEEANKVINEDRAKINVKVKGSFQTGSFTVLFAISVFDHIKDIFSSSGMNALLNAEKILELIFGTGGFIGLVCLLKQLKGRKIEKIYENDDGSFTIEIDAKKIKIEKKVYELYRNYKIRKSFENLVQPVAENDGISDLGIKYHDKKEEFCKIDKSETIFFKCPISEEEKYDEDTLFTTNISIVNLSFKEGNKWFVNDGQASFYVKVEDREFLNKIENSHVAFAKGDILKVKIRREQFYNKDEKRLKTENFIEEVINHGKPPEQMDIFNIK